MVVASTAFQTSNSTPKHLPAIVRQMHIHLAPTFIATPACEFTKKALPNKVFSFTSTPAFSVAPLEARTIDDRFGVFVQQVVQALQATHCVTWWDAAWIEGTAPECSREYPVDSSECLMSKKYVVMTCCKKFSVEPVSLFCYFRHCCSLSVTSCSAL